MDKKEQTRLRVERYRERKSVTDNVTQSPDSVTNEQDNVTPDVTQYPAIMYALTDPGKRTKLEKVYQSLKDHKVKTLVRYGCYGPTFDVCGELLEITQ